MRGAPAICVSLESSLGIIPACAGSTVRADARWSGDGDHPRMCGEHLVAMALSATWPGSSPHVRGAPAEHPVRCSYSGIIPACAGSTVHRFEPHVHEWDHPRMCGEHDASEAEEPSSLGSSPHVRGAPDLSRRTVALPRIIPACAGSTRPDRRPRGARRDHPRMCGEHLCSQCNASFMTGSSPHVRGALDRL